MLRFEYEVVFRRWPQAGHSPPGTYSVRPSAGSLSATVHSYR
jgi:hypothetical protein